MTKGRVLILFVIAAAIYVFFALHLGEYLSLAYFKSQQAAIHLYFERHPWRTVGLFALGYIAVAGLSLPGATVMSLVGGAVFGVLWGTVVVSFASTIGATLAFLVSRFLLRDAVQRRFGPSLKAVNDGIERDGAFYLFTLRLVPAFPFFVINLVMGLTTIRTATFYLVSQIGMLAGTVVYVNAGTQLAAIDSLRGILSPGLIGSFTLLGIFPLLARKFVGSVRRRRIYRRYPRPARFDRNLVVIGAGSAGLVSAYIAAAVHARVTLIERDRMGGDCLNTGCVPSKALIRTTRLLAEITRASEFGLGRTEVDFEFAEVMEHVQGVIRRVAPHDSVERYTALGVECIHGDARISSPFSVEINGRTLTTRNIVIATGGHPHVPQIPGLREAGYRTSDTIWDLRMRPDTLVVLGGGPVGCELAQCFARLGSRVIQVHRRDRLLPREDPEVGQMVMKRFVAEGIELRLEHKPKKVDVRNGRKVLLCDCPDGEFEIPFDEMLVATGRRANTNGLGLEGLGIPLSGHGTVAVNEYLQTVYPNIYACGDVAGPYQFTHTAAHQAWYAAVNALFGRLRRFKADYSVIPWATFTEPEVARVGLNETDAKANGVDYEITIFALEELDRAIVDEEARGMVRVLTVPGRDRILGATIVGEHAGEVIIEFISAMRHGIGLNKILSTIHIYPTLAEANKYAAGVWKRAHSPQRVLRWLERYHRWRL